MNRTIGIGLALALAAIASAGPRASADRPAGRRSPGQKQSTAKPPVKGTAEPKRSTYGDVTLSGYNQLSFQGDLSKVRFTGPNTLVEVPEKSSNVVMRLHADEIVFQRGTGSGHEQIDARSRVRYTITQTTAAGPRILNGTASEGSYRRDQHKVRLSGGMRAELTDPRLEGPGSIQAGTATVDISDSPYVYDFSGDAASTDLHFTPRAAAGRKPGGPVTGPVHITHWAASHFAPGKSASFEGAAVVADLEPAGGGRQGQLIGRRIACEFAPTGEISTAKALQNVHYRYERPTTQKAADGTIRSGREQVTGTSGEAIYEAADGRLTLAGGVDATLLSTLSLQEPAHLLADRVVVSEVAEKERHFVRYELTGVPNHRRITLVPRPSEPAPKPAVRPDAPGADAAADKPAPSGPTFVIGAVDLTGFKTGVLIPGRSIDFVSDGEQALLLDTTDQPTRSSSHIETHHFVAALGETGGVTQAETMGPVTFHIQQPAPSQPAADGAGRPKTLTMQALDGKAAKAVYSAAGAARLLKIQGPLTANITDPAHFEGPAVVKGQAGDSISIDLVTRLFDFQTPKATMTVDLTPKPSEGDKPAPTRPTVPTTKGK